MSKHEENGVTAKVETITPAQAEELLATNKNMRAVSIGHLNRLANQMKAGTFETNGESVKVDHKGRLVDGQHRLQAAILADVPLRTVVVRGIKDALTVDIGMRRQLHQILSGMGWTQANSAAAAIKILHSLSQGKDPFVSGGRTDISLVTLVSYMRKIDRSLLEEAGRYAYQAHFAGMTAPGCYTAFAYQALQIDRDRFIEMHESIKSGLGLKATDPVYVLRRFVMRGHRRYLKSNNGRRTVYGALVKTWNSIADGKLRQLIRMTDDQELPALAGAE